MGTRWDGSHLNAQATLARRICRAHTCHLKQNLRRMQTMPRVKQASKQKRTTKAAAVTVLGATGLGFSLLGSASASTMPAADIAQSDNTSPNQRFVLSEEEMADVSLATFHLLDKENVGSGVQLARGCGGCRGCAARGCRAARPVAAVAARSVAARSVAARSAARSAARPAAVAHLGDIAACAKSHDLTARR